MEERGGPGRKDVCLLHHIVFKALTGRLVPPYISAVCYLLPRGSGYAKSSIVVVVATRQLEGLNSPAGRATGPALPITTLSTLQFCPHQGRLGVSVQERL
jgi:hypothetical protein